MVYRVAKDLKFCYGHRLLNYDGKCRYLHGHNGRVQIILEGDELDDRGMVVDFTDVKIVMNRWIDDHLDHRMLLNERDPLLPVLREHNEPVFVMSCNPTAEALARLIFEAARSHDFPVVKVKLWETDSSTASYCPGAKGSAP